jgi:hypothetical protein
MCKSVSCSTNLAQQSTVLVATGDLMDCPCSTPQSIDVNARLEEAVERCERWYMQTKISIDVDYVQL